MLSMEVDLLEYELYCELETEGLVTELLRVGFVG